MLLMVQLDTTAEVVSRKIGANMDTPFKVDTVLNFDDDFIFDTS